MALSSSLAHNLYSVTLLLSAADKMRFIIAHKLVMIARARASLFVRCFENEKWEAAGTGTQLTIAPLGAAH
jgi:hypothetical protein